MSLRDGTDCPEPYRFTLMVQLPATCTGTLDDGTIENMTKKKPGISRLFERAQR
ncbi:MAG: hypothetical protein IJ088_03615 [Clostridia bacterium]|nr:hypothetical protein [Clostridia bacterium]